MAGPVSSPAVSTSHKPPKFPVCYHETLKTTAVSSAHYCVSPQPEADRQRKAFPRIFIHNRQKADFPSIRKSVTKS